MKFITTYQHTVDELKQLQSLPLDEKIQITKTRVIEFYNHYDGQVYVSFSGGKDSTVLLHIVRSIFPEVSAVFIDTGLEYPEIRDFVKSFDNVEWLRPIMYDKESKQYKQCSFKTVIEKVGYPVIGKDISNSIFVARNKPSGRTASKFDDSSAYCKKYGPRYSLSKWKYLIDAPFKISSRCCDVMKKNPAKHYEQDTGRHPIIGMMAEESDVRKNSWLKSGCNAFEDKRPSSNPMSFWKEQDVLTYLHRFHDEILSDIAFQSKYPWASVYGELNCDNKSKYKFSGEQRTGCMFCMYGVQNDKKPNRFQRMKITHPKQYEYCMKPKDEGGLGLAEVLQYIGVDYE